MSLKPTLMTLTSVLACGVVLFAASHMSKESTPVDNGKSAKFLPNSQRLAKPNQALEVSIEPVNGFPETNSEAALLRATVRSPLAAGTKVSYRWILPDGASLDSGHEDGVLEVPAAGRELTLDISLRGFSSEGDIRNLKLELNVANAGVGGVAVFSSHPTRSDLTRGYRETKTGRSLDPAAKGPNGKPRLPAGVNL